MSPDGPSRRPRATDVRFGVKADVAATKRRRLEFNCAVAQLVALLGREHKLPQRNHQPIEVGGDDQSGLPAR